MKSDKYKFSQSKRLLILTIILFGISLATVFLFFRRAAYSSNARYQKKLINICVVQQVEVYHFFLEISIALKGHMQVSLTQRSIV